MTGLGLDSLEGLAVVIMMVAAALGATREAVGPAALLQVGRTHDAYCRDHGRLLALAADRDRSDPYLGLLQAAGGDPGLRSEYVWVRRRSPSLGGLVSQLLGYTAGYAAGTGIKVVYRAGHMWYVGLRRVAVNRRSRPTGEDMTQDSAATEAESAPMSHRLELDIAAGDTFHQTLDTVSHLVEGLAVVASLKQEHGPAGGNPLFSFTGSRETLLEVVNRYTDVEEDRALLADGIAEAPETEWRHAH